MVSFQHVPKIIANLKEPLALSVFLFTLASVFGVSYYLMATLPGSRDFMCMLGANLTVSNILFSLLLSLMAGILVAGLVTLYRLKASRQKFAISSFSGIGVIIGIFTTFCTLCTIPVISFFGLGISLVFFTDYELYFKVLSLIFLSFSMWLLNRQLYDECDFCVS